MVRVKHPDPTPGRGVTLAQAAVHEAGHAVALYALLGGWYEVERISVVKTRRSGGRCWSRPLLDAPWGKGVWTRGHWFCLAVEACAGYAACLAAGYPAKKAVRGCRTDFEEAVEEARAAGRSLVDALDEAVTLMSLPGNVAAVSSIACGLRRHGTVSGDPLRNLMRWATRYGESGGTGA